MDATIKRYPLNEKSLSQAIKEICEINVGDDVTFSFVKVGVIREDDEYGDFRVSIQSVLDTIITPINKNSRV